MTTLTTRLHIVPSGDALSFATGQFWREDAAPAERGPHIAVHLALRDAATPADGQFSTGVVFDTTRLDWSHAG